MYYGKVRVETAAYQDDIAKPCGDVLSAQSGMTRLAAMLSERGLVAHREKTGYLVVGSEVFREEVEKEVELTPLMFGEFKVTRKRSDKYLGQVLHEGGLARSVEATIEERASKIKGAIYTTASIINTIEMQCMGSQDPVGERHRAQPAQWRRHLGGDHQQGGGEVRGAAGALLEDGVPGAEGNPKGDAEGRDEQSEDEVQNMEGEDEDSDDDKKPETEPGEGSA